MDRRDARLLELRDRDRGPAEPSLWLSARIPVTAEQELMERPCQDPRVLAETLDDLARINRWFGGIHLTLWALDRLTGSLPRGSRMSILDVATGGADIPEAISEWGRRRGLRVAPVASDVNPEILTLVPYRRRRIIPVVAADALCLPFEDRAFDVSVCSLALHHFDPDDAVRMMAEMWRVARLGVVVNDLVRSWHGYIGAWLVGHILTRNPLTRHDSTLSIKRAYTREEMKSLARRAGLVDVQFAGFLGYRVAMLAERSA